MNTNLRIIPVDNIANEKFDLRKIMEIRKSAKSYDGAAFSIEAFNTPKTTFRLGI